jgi:CYTH domain-containing protein
MAREIERKFLVEDRPPGLDDHPHDTIEQGYVAIDAVAEVRVRRRGGDCTLTIKSAPARTRLEEEFAIEPERFEALWALADGRRIVKTRYLVPWDGVTVEVDEYHGDLEGLRTAEVEFADEAASDAFAPPPWLGREITGDRRYANQALASETQKPSR